MNKIFITAVLSASTIWASGNQNPTAPNAAEVRVSSAVVPSGGTVQLQFSLTEPKPIMSTGTGFALDEFSAWGISLWTPTGEACGVGTIVNGKLNFIGLDPTGTLGTSLDYPFLTVTLRVPEGKATGTTYPFKWDTGSFLSTTSLTYDLTVKPGTVTIGGSVYISGIFPGGGTYPAGSVIHVMGGGFSQQTKITKSTVQFSSMRVVSPNEIDLVLKSATKMDAQFVSLQNPDRSTANYYAYLRGTLLTTPSKDLLKNAEYAFPISTHAIASLGPAPALSASQYTALALQNSNPGPAAVTLTLTSAVNGTTSATIVMPSGTRIVDTVSQLLNGAMILPGDIVSLNSTAMIQILGLNGDDAAQTLTPFIPTF